MVSPSPMVPAPGLVQKKDRPPHICIIGGGFGGLYTALYTQQICQRRRQPCVITVLEPRDRFLFTPLLYELLTDSLKPWEIAPRYADLLQGTGIRHVQCWVQQVCLGDRTVTLDRGEVLNYDYLVVATGSEERSVPLPGLAEHAYRFRSLSDVEALENRLADLEQSGQDQVRVTIVGGGPSGVELACTLSDRLTTQGQNPQIQLIERSPEILKLFPAPLRRTALSALRQRRITIRPNTTVLKIAADSIVLQDLSAGSGSEPAQSESIEPTDLVLWVAGTRPAPWMGLESVAQTQTGQVLTQPTLALASFPTVFVVGDQTEMTWTGDRPAPQTAQSAYQAAAIVAHNLVASIQNRRLKSFKYLHLGDMMTLGQQDALISCLGLVLRGPLAGLLRQGVYLQRLPTWRHRLQVLRYRSKCCWQWLKRLGRRRSPRY